MTEWNPWQAEVLYCTPVWQIGKHEWQMIVYVHPRYGNLTGFQWRKPAHQLMGQEWPATMWKRDVDWPKYDGDHCDGGMPRTLRKLYENHQSEIATALGEDQRNFDYRRDPINQPENIR